MQAVGAPDYAMGVYHLKKGIEGGEISGLFTLGEIYRNGVGVDVDYEKAFQFHKAAVEKGEKKSLRV